MLSGALRSLGVLVLGCKFREELFHQRGCRSKLVGVCDPFPMVSSIREEGPGWGEANGLVGVRSH